MKRLSEQTLAELPPGVARPAYDRSKTSLGVVHLGVGAFHRAHQAVYLDDRLAAGETSWAICGASLRSPATASALLPQDSLYTVSTRSGEEQRHRVVGSISNILTAPGQLQDLLAVMSRPEVRIVSMTVTEKGYCHDPATGTLQEDHRGVIADLTQPQAPHTVPGILVEALRRRRESQIAPFTILCCDNLPANGKTVARVISRYASLINADLGSYVESEVACPSTMVDRIVPATTAEDREAIRNELGLEDAWPISTEPFTQWVIEDRFSSGRPRLEDSGAQLVTDVSPYELMKLRLLNGSHSALAYLGYLAGCETIADVMADPSFAHFTQTLMDDEVTPTLQVPPRVDLQSYKRSLLARFSNTALHHRTWQIAMDGSQKLPQRLLGTVRDRLATGAPIPHLALGIAAWMRYVSGVDEKGHHIDVRDPLSNRLRSLSDIAGGSPEGLARGLLSVHEIFGDLAMDARFVRAVTHALNAHFRLGARGAVEAVHSM